jgi:predicted dehydrogenase
MNLRAGLVGLGVMGSHHAKVMHGLAGVHFVAAADPAGDVHGAARGIPIVGTVADLLSFGLDYCVVAVPASQHVAVASVLAEAGVHTLVEKPIATDSIAAYALADAFERAGLVNAVGYTEIYNPTVRTLHEYLKIGFLGSLHHIGTRRQGSVGALPLAGAAASQRSHDIG